VGDGRRETRHASDSLDLTAVVNRLLGGPEPKENMLRYFYSFSRIRPGARIYMYEKVLG